MKPSPSLGSFRPERRSGSDKLPTYSRMHSDIDMPPSPLLSNHSDRSSFIRAGTMMTSPSKPQFSPTPRGFVPPQPMGGTVGEFRPVMEQEEQGFETNPGKFLGTLANPMQRFTLGGRIPQVGFGGVDKSSRDINPLYTSPEFRNSRVQPVAPPTEIVRAICAIYTLGHGYDSATQTFGRPNGLGFLLNESLLMTSYSVLPDEEVASFSYAQFRDGEVYKFDPSLCFTASKMYAFTIVAFKEQHTSTALRYVVPLTITQLFTLKAGSSINYLPHNHYSTKSAVKVDKDYFTAQTSKPETVLPGTPFFDNHWSAQGFYVKTSNKLHIAVRFEPILAFLSAHLVINHNDLLARFLNAGAINFVDKFSSRFLYYFEWHGKKAWRYDIDREVWEEIAIRNYEHITKQRPDWTFNWGARLVYLKSGSILLLGGRERISGSETDEVWMFSPQKFNIMSRLSPMGNVRDSCVAVVIDDSFIYVLGGKPHLDSCERYSISGNSWQPIASMYYGRYDAAACTALEARYIFVFGGQPLNTSGTSVERYNIEMNQWELLGVSLPRPLYRLTAFPITSRRIAILGGNGSHWVYIMYVERSIAMVNLVTGSGSQDFYIMKDGQRNLDEPVETVFPVAYDRSRSRLYMLNLARQSATTKIPGISTYNVEFFNYTEPVDFMEKPVEIPVAPFSLQRTGFNTYYM